jgi:flagellar motor protein MotB
MARKNKKKSSVNKDAWLNTYADMITLVLVFFILLYSMSTSLCQPVAWSISFKMSISKEFRGF